MTAVGRVLLVYTLVVATALAVSVAAFGIHSTLIVFGVIEVASLLLITVLSYGEPGLVSGMQRARQVSSPDSEQLALFNDLMKQSRGSRPILALLAIPPRRS